MGIVIAASIALVAILLKPARRKQKLPQSPSPDNASSTPVFQKWQRWLIPVGAALILAVWTFWGALMFLAVVWILMQNPKTDSDYSVGKEEQSTAKRIYTWLFWSSVITVPTFIVTFNRLDWNSSINERVLAALIPLIFHSVLLFGLASKSAFVYRHTQQGILLMALRATMAALSVSIERYPDNGMWLFIIGNGSLWLFGTIWGRNQVIRNDCWWLRWKGETIILTDVKPAEQLITNNELGEMLKSLNAEGNNARQIALNAFRTGTPDARKKAVLILTELGEVENF